MRRLVVLTAFLLCLESASVALAEANWFSTPARKDDLTGETVGAGVAIQDDEKNEKLRSVLALTHNKEGKLIAIIGLNSIDRLPPGSGDVSVSYRADGSDLQKSTMWKRDGVNTAFREITPEEAQSLVAGKFVIVSFDSNGKRYRYETTEQADKLRAAVKSLVEKPAK
jgi:hypothetical protein